MFELDVPDLPGGPSRAPAAKTHSLQIDLTGMPVAELLSLRSQIEQLLPARDLKDMDLARELVLQVMALQQMQQTVLRDDDTPANQKAQVANSLSAALINLVKLQVDVYSSERFKSVESVLISVLQTLPIEAQERFIGAYETALAEMR